MKKKKRVLSPAKPVKQEEKKEEDVLSSSMGEGPALAAVSDNIREAGNAVGLTGTINSYFSDKEKMSYNHNPLGFACMGITGGAFCVKFILYPS